MGNKAALGLILVIALCLLFYACSDPWLSPVSVKDNTANTVSRIRVSTPVRPQSGKVDQTLTFTAGVNIDLGEECKYGFNWGDGSYNWSSNAIASHSWSSSGIYIVRAQVRCGDVISEWSLGKVVMIGSAAISRRPLNEPGQAKRYITPDVEQVDITLKKILANRGKSPYSDFDLIREWLAANISYKRDADVYSVNDYWQLPIETLERKTGDCEDLAILLCSLLRADGVSPEDVYVAIGCTQGTDNCHAYLFERYTKGFWRAIEPQIDPITSVISFELIDQVLTYDYSSNIFYFNDVHFFRGIPNLGSTVYETQVAQSFWPLIHGASVTYERELNTEQEVRGSIKWLGGEKIMFGWELSIYDPRGDVVLNWKGNDISHDFRLITSMPGIHRIEIVKRDFVARYVRLSIDPPNWRKLKDE